MAKLTKLEKQLFDALEEAQIHLDFTGYGDSYERQAADLRKLPEKIEAALNKAKEKMAA